MDEKLEQFKQWIIEADKIVFFGGAGVSTESGIPDFRSVDGLYNQKYKYPPETILSRSFYVNHLADFYEFYREKMLCSAAFEKHRLFKLFKVLFAAVHGEADERLFALIIGKIKGNIHLCSSIAASNAFSALSAMT